MRLSTLLFGILYLTTNLIAQNSTENFTISGQVKVRAGNEIVQPIEFVMIEINKLHKATFSDSLGHFKLNEVKSGEYKISFSGFGYQKSDTTITIKDHSIDNLKICVTVNSCNINEIRAEQDIKNGKIKLLIVSSIAPIYYKNQHDFEKKFKIEYLDYGDTIPSALECITLYNKTIFRYLDAKYGKLWRLEVRQDVIGL